MDRIIVTFLTGARAGQTEVYPAARFQALYFGRDSKSDVRFDAEIDNVVSRSHAVIEWQEREDGGRDYLLTDLLSSNGTWLDGRRVEGTVPLQSGAELMLGVGGPRLRIVIEAPRPEVAVATTQTVPAAGQNAVSAARGDASR